MIDESAARSAAEAVVAAWPKASEPEHQPVIWRVEEHARAWVCHFATPRWLETRDFHDMLIGVSPIVVEKADGEVHVYGSSPDQYELFKAWLD